MIPFTVQITPAAFQPPNLLANIAIVALSKNKGINPGIRKIGDLKIINPNSPMTCPNVPNINPRTTDFGANANVAAQSTPATAPGNNFSEIPLNYIIISPTNIRTPANNT